MYKRNEKEIKMQRKKKVKIVEVYAKKKFPTLLCTVYINHKIKCFNYYYVMMKLDDEI